MLRLVHAPARLGVLATLLAVLLHTHPAAAEVRITGDPDAVRVEARDTSLEEVLAALGAKFGLRYRSKAPLDRGITGTYAGPLPRVVTRLLDGYDFIVKTNSGTIEVIVLGANRAGAPIAGIRPRRAD